MNLICDELFVAMQFFQAFMCCHLLSVTRTTGAGSKIVFIALYRSVTFSRVALTRPGTSKTSSHSAGLPRSR